MNNRQKSETLPFVKYHTGLSYLFNPAETRFILHMIDIEYKKSNGYNVNWSRAQYMKIMGLNEYTFDKCIKRMIEIGLLSKRNNDLGNKVYYSFDMKVYDKLVKILTSTYNVNKLIHFCDSVFKNQQRMVQSVTNDEIILLKAKH
ncbi:hypothetical protein [Dysgonomonas sp. GY617]|uniref:hypothetical protein n=1 Tax=Dysgonomonas sp. GY617 TaxID=2780420 RepID=UPI00188470B5|nr:hypothetical protein [Dysgonomonas sp. GY617]MBF0577402.1 hypothetical protein [Dysgonomonas sp. GY617]